MSQPAEPIMPAIPRHDYVIVGCFVQRGRVPEALAALDGEEVLVAVRVPREALQTELFVKLSAIGTLHVRSST